MRPGQLDQRITLQGYSDASDGAGGLSRTWANFASFPSVWARVLANSGNERFEDDRTNATATTTFFIRNRDDVTEKDRILWRDEIYNIRHVMRQGVRDMYLKIVAERGASTGEG
jgi:SPP1 family predicted phage head-tail adaptor